MKTETKIILGMMAGSEAFGIKHTTISGKKVYKVLSNHLFSYLLDDDCVVTAKKICSITDDQERVFENIDYDDIVDKSSDNTQWFINNPEPFLYLIKIGILPKYYANKLEQDGIKIEWI